MLKTTFNSIKNCLGMGIQNSRRNIFLQRKKEETDELIGYEIEFEPLPELKKSSQT